MRKLFKKMNKFNLYKTLYYKKEKISNMLLTKKYNIVDFRRFLPKNINTNQRTEY